jgi:hypothetical protein
MTIEIALKNSYGRLSVREPFLIATDTPVVLAFHSDYALKDTMVKFISDTGKSCSFRLANLSEIEIPQAFVHAGTVTVEVALIVKEQVVKRWSVEPIVLAEDSTGFSLHPEFEDIRARLTALETVANNHTLALSELQEEFGEMNETVTGIDSIVNDPLE